MNRWSLWEDIAAAVRAAFPDRADALLASLERWIEPGPWSASITAPRDAASRDRVLADVERALRSHDADLAATRFRELERWIHDSAIVAAHATLGLRGILPDWGDATVDWAVHALEAGLDTPSLRILAGIRPHVTSDVEDWLERTLRELKVARNEVAELRAAALYVAREAVQGRIEPVTASRRMYDIAVSLPPGNGDLEIWSQLHWDFDLDWSERALTAYQREVIEAARSMLGAPGITPG